MKRIIQELLIVAIVAPLCGTAQGETMAERKQRIMRKYLCERQTVVQTGLIPEITGEDEQIAESEKFQQPKADELSRKDRATPPSQPVLRPVPASSRRQNWMFNEEDSDFDPNADPFALNTGDNAPEEKKSWWTQWQERQDRLGSDPQAGDASGTYDSRRDDYYYDGSRAQYNRSEYQRSPRGGYGYSSMGESDSKSSTSSRFGPYDGVSRYGTSPSSGMLDIPSSTRSSTDMRSQTPSDSYTPYKSPFQQSRQDQRRMQTTPQPQQEEFRRTSPYQQWKSNNKEWDPTADDAYVDELMQRNRR